ncbi:MAG: GntR family transcriptional regulator, partial [Clostridia bacterium]|nr:GntR family transcriptional regulator [Clostridia bacterium]
MEKEKKFLYQKVYDGIKDLLETDVYRKALEEGAMTKLPSEKELCARYGVSLITLNKALRMLAQEGYVKRVPGKGTYIQNKQQAGSTPVSKGKENSRRLIGVILEHVSNSFGLDLMYFLDLFAARAEYKIVIRFSYGERERETEEIRFLLSMGVSGLIIMPSHGKHYSQEIRRLCLNNFPIVLIDKKIQGIPVPSVRTNNNEATASLVRELVKAGCTQIALISTDYLEADSVRERRTGYIEEMARQGQKEAGICA